MKTIIFKEDIPRLKLLGVGFSETRALKKNLLLAIQELGLNVILEEEEDLEKLMQYGISGIPALMLGERILLQRQAPGVEVLKDILRGELGGSGRV